MTKQKSKPKQKQFDVNQHLDTLKPILGTTDTKVGEMLVYKNDNIISLSLALYGEYCHAEVDIMSRYLDNTSIYVDVGTNIGYHALAVYTQTGCHVRGFEPHPTHFSVAAYNCRDKPIRIYNTAVGNSNGTITLQDFDPESFGNYGEIKFDNNGTINASIIRLDDLEELTHCDLIKIDVEGLELDVLHGATRLLNSSRPVIFYEAIDRENYEPCLSYLRDMQYKQYWVTCRNKPLAPTYKQTDENPFEAYGVSNILAVPAEREQPKDLAPVEEGETFLEMITRYQNYKLLF
jgi:FkbM family methyltransferase